MRNKPAVSILILLMASPLFGDVKLPAIFGDHMVLQRDAKVPVWGWADPDEAVTVTAGNIKANGKAGADGKWKVALEGLKASDQPIDLTVAGKNTLSLHDVLVGDVWVCSGQSNMEFGFGGGKFGFGGVHNVAQELPKANHPTMRLFIVKRTIAFEPQTDVAGTWKVCTPDTAGPFSAVGYFFGRDIQEDQHVPVGMIGTYWGGTRAESWTSLEALQAVPQLAGYARRFEGLKSTLAARKQVYETQTLPNWKKDRADWAAWFAASTKAKAAGEAAPTPPTSHKPLPSPPLSPDADSQVPTVLNNGMIDPIVPYAIKGAIWYQGESNTDVAKLYRTLFPTMITDWRARWGEGDFPFIWVQLANYLARSPQPTRGSEGWPGVREAQSMTLKLPNTGQAVIIDIGQWTDIHPKDKMDVGARLALAARHVAYGEDIVFSGPTYDAMQVDGDKVRITFKNVGSGLTIAAGPSTRPGVPPAAPASELKGFSIAGADQKFVWADATIDGNAVVVSSADVHDPQAVRYAWANNPEANLYNKDGLPASPFRTDNAEAPPAKPVPAKPVPAKAQ